MAPLESVSFREDISSIRLDDVSEASDGFKSPAKIPNTVQKVKGRKLNRFNR